MSNQLLLPYHDTQRMMQACHDSRFVPPDEFLSLLLGRRKLVRSDSKDWTVRGLLDVQTGERYLIEEEALWQ
jgi:hypothetical protein